MKTLLAAIALSFIASVAQASAPQYYNVNFEIASISPMCPATIPHGAQCMALGQLVKVAAPLNGCLDKIVFTKFNQVMKKNTLVIYAVGVAFADPKSATARCIRQNVYTETVPVQYGVKDIQLVNTTVNY